MLSDRAKRELKELAASPQVRADFGLLEEAWRHARARISVDQYVAFLSTMSRLNYHSSLPRPSTPFDNARL